MALTCDDDAAVTDDAAEAVFWLMVEPGLPVPPASAVSKVVGRSISR